MKTLDKARCCGCAACTLVCPKQCINMREDEAGFIYPYVDADSCISCGRCNQVCPIENHHNEMECDHQAFAAYASDKETRNAGSSGGMFGVFAKRVIEKGGRVYGAAFDDKLQLRTASACSMDELLPLYKSKYLQCDPGDSFIQIRRYLEENETVLFVSTPCYVCALQRYLGHSYENLITVDFFCHGVPSQSFFNRCIGHQEKQKGQRIVGYKFRAKRKRGATPHYYTERFIRNGKTKERTRLYVHSPFYLGFQKYITLRDGCYICSFAFSSRVSDITIGDFHNIDRYMSGINRFDGVSTVMLHTAKGEKLWEQCKDDIVAYPMDAKQLILNKECMAGPTPMPEIRSAFISDLRNKDFSYVLKKYLNAKDEIMKIVYYSLPKPVRSLAKRLIHGD